MNIKTLRVIFLFGAMLESSIILAGGWSGSANILEIYPSSGHNGVLIKHSSMPNPDSCPESSYYILDKNNTFFKEIFSLLISAQARQSNINLQVVGCNGKHNFFPSIHQVIAK